MKLKSTSLLLGSVLCLLTLASSSTLSAQNYDNAVGLRAGWGLGVTGKHFFSENLAGEAIVRYRNLAVGSNFSIQALAEVHTSLDDVLSGLSWYYGGGAIVNIFSGGNVLGVNVDGTTSVGLSGVIGLDLALGDLPLNISIDWIPTIFLSGGSSFSGENGLFAIRYILP